MSPEKWAHGSRHVYSVYKCRCELCSKANRDYMRNYERRDYRREHRRQRLLKLEQVASACPEPPV